MRKPYDSILLVAIGATIIYFVLFDKPINPDRAEDMHDIGVFGLVYVGLIFGIISLARLYFKRRW